VTEAEQAVSAQDPTAKVEKMSNGTLASTSSSIVRDCPLPYIAVIPAYIPPKVAGIEY
jgi:hypothetical protein